MRNEIQKERSLWKIKIEAHPKEELPEKERKMIQKFLEGSFRPWLEQLNEDLKKLTGNRCHLHW